MRAMFLTVVALGFCLTAWARGSGESPRMAAPAMAPASMRAAAFPEPPVMAAETGKQTAVLAGGCFWGIEGVFERLRGVVDVVSGYSGGDASTADYEIVSSGVTGHAESVSITYDAAQINYATLLKVFFSVAHDPTQLNYQGPDHGTQYRSAIFYATDEQKRVAEAYIRTLDQAKLYAMPVVTQVVPLKAFYPAEDYHQNFLDQNPTYPYIVYWDMPKIEDLEKTWPDIYVAKAVAAR